VGEILRCAQKDGERRLKQVPRRGRRSLGMTTRTEADLTATATSNGPAEAGRYRRNYSRVAFILREEVWGRVEGVESKVDGGCIILFSLLREMVTRND